MTLDINKIKAAALAATQGDNAMTRITAHANLQELTNPSAVLELIDRLEAAERDAAKWQEYQSKRARILEYSNPTGSGQLAAMKEKP